MTIKPKMKAYIVQPIRLFIYTLMFAFLPIGIRAQNPIIQTNYTADPAPMVHKGTVYVYTTHDEDKTVRNFFTMNDWRCYSTTDMVNWTDHGAILNYQDFTWARGDAWAGQCVPKNGKFYFYVPINQKNGGNAIGVAVSDSPTGPFKDAIGAPLLVGYGYIDPTVFIDDDGEAYLYWGNPKLWYVKLNPDMISYDQKVGIVQVPMTEESFKARVINAHATFAWAKSIDVSNAHSVKGPDNNFYWYVSALEKSTNKRVIGVAKGTKAMGPFTDVLGKPLISEKNLEEKLNPTVVVDAEKQAYLTWGDSVLWYAKLNSDMISYDLISGIGTVPTEKRDWFASKIRGTVYSTEKRATTYEEGPWLFKRDNRYYLLYPAGGVPEHFAYSTSTSPTGPWIYGDTIMTVIKEGGAFTNHPGYIEFKGKSYLFYHNGALPGGGGFKRSVCVEPFCFNADGSIPSIQPTKTGVLESASLLNPFERVEAETVAWEDGIETVKDANVGVYVSDISNGDFIKVRSVDFNKGAKSFVACLASVTAGGQLEIRLDDKQGALIGTLEIKGTGGPISWNTQTCRVEKTKGVHDVYFVFKVHDGSTFSFDWWKFM
jgi:arabinoxylan arabinofuranohydrolase